VFGMEKMFFGIRKHFLFTFVIQKKLITCSLNNIYYSSESETKLQIF
jgi:hypothetical protein